MRSHLTIAAAAAALLATGCSTGKVGDTVESAGETLAEGAEAVADGAGSLVNVNLSNVLNDLALDLDIDEANIPINAQIPITIAANVCGVSINILSVSTGGQANCTATSTSPELSQVVQQQLAAGGSVGGGGQTSGSSTTTGTTSTTSTSTTTQEPDPTPDPQL